MQIRKRTHAALLILTLGFFNAVAGAQTVTIRKIADTDTLVPGGTGTFRGFVSDPVIDRGHVAFTGTSVANEVGIYTDLGGVLRPVVDRNTIIPGTAVTFSSASGPSIDTPSVAFRGFGPTPHRGVYLETNGVISLVAELGSPAPGGVEVFNYFANTGGAYPSLENGRVAFAARRSAPEGNLSVFGVYVEDNGFISVVAETTTTIPGFSEVFSMVSAPSQSGGNVAFIGTGPGGLGGTRGLYIETETTLRTMVDSNEPIPNGTGNFSSFAFASLDGEDIAFGGRGSDSQQGIYAIIDGILDVVVDRNMTGLPIAALGPAIENGNVVANFGPGIIYTNLGGTLFRVIGHGDMLEGKTISLAYCGREALSGNEIVFFALSRYGEDDETHGIYVATITDLCGNGVIETGEECDDGNYRDGDGCHSNCAIQIGYMCIGEPSVCVRRLILPTRRRLKRH